ncbi:MAG: serine/threonine-protein kinase, partial [Pirellulaceae bacterium]
MEEKQRPGESEDLANDESLLDVDQILALTRLELVFRDRSEPDGEAAELVAGALKSATTTSRHAVSGLNTGFHNIGQFELRRFLGEGTFGVVYEAIDPRSGQQVAVKIARSSVQSDGKSRERFLSEARIASRLDHVGIARILEVGEDRGLLFLVSQYCNGCTLDHWAFGLPAQNRYQDIARLFAKIARAVGFGHGQGVIHRDLKPANIMVTAGEDGAPSPMVLDFGLAFVSEEGLRQTGSSVLLGTPLYMSPEQLGDQAVSPASDIFSIGVILYESLVGITPFDAPTLPDVFQRIQLGQFKSPRTHVKDLPIALEAICLKCLRYDPSDRYASALALGEDLEAFAQGKAVEVTLPSRLERSKWFLRRPQLPRELSLVLIGVNGLVLAWAVINFPLAMLVLPQSPEQSSSQVMYWPVVAAIIPVHNLLLVMSVRLFQGRQTRRGVIVHLSLTIAIALLAVLLICVPAPLS